MPDVTRRSGLVSTDWTTVALVCLVTLVARGGAAEVVNDVTQQNPKTVARVVEPKSVDEVRRLVREQKGPISVGGGRYSMGGQIATDGVLFLDMRSMDRVLALDVEKRTVTVEAGITWRERPPRLAGARLPHSLWAVGFDEARVQRVLPAPDPVARRD
jgi:hypothetical protein